MIMLSKYRLVWDQTFFLYHTPLTFTPMIKAKFRWPKESAKTSRPTNTYALSGHHSGPQMRFDLDSDSDSYVFDHVWGAVAAATSVGIMQPQPQPLTGTISIFSFHGITVITISKLPPSCSGRANKQFCKRSDNSTVN